MTDPSGAPLAGVEVSLPELALSTVSAEDGSFGMSGVPAGRYVLLCEGPGLVPSRLPFTLPSEGLDRPLEVVVMDAGSIKRGGGGEVSEDRLEALEDLSQTGLGDAGGVKVQLLCTNCNAASLSMLGLTSDHLEMTLDGVPLLEGIEQVWALSMVPPEAVTKMRMEPGPGSVLSGSHGLAGRLDLITVDPFSGAGGNFTLTRGSYDLWSESVYGRGTITENLGADVIATHSTSDAINPNEDLRNEQGAIDRETLTARFHYRFADDHRLRIGLHGYREDQWDAPGSYTSTWRKEIVPIQRRAAHVAYQRDFDNGAFLRAVGLVSNRDQVIDEETEIFGSDELVYELAYDIEADWELGRVHAGGLVGDRLLLEGGAIYSREVMDVFQRFTAPGDPKNTHDVVNQMGGFLQGTVTLPHRVDLLFGLRYDDYDDFGSGWSPRFALRWKPRHGLYLKLGLGESFRAPRPVFEEVCCGNRYQSNSDVDSETGRAAHLSLAWYPTQRVKLTFAGMVSEFDDYILHLVTGHAGFNAVYRNENVREVRISGAELGVQVRFERISFGGSYGLVDTDFDGDVLAPVVGVGNGEDTLILPESEGRLPYVTEDTGSAYVTWTGRHWNANLQADWYGEQWIQVLNEDAPTVSTELRSVDPYWSVNARAGRKIRSVEVFAGVDNLLDEYQDDFEDFRTSAKWGLQRGRFWYAGVGWNF